MAIDTLWYTRCPAPTAASVAIRLGWLEDEFKRDGIAVLSLASSKDKAVHLSHYQHSQPNSFRFGGHVPPLVTKSRGADVKIIGLSWHDRTAAIYALPASGIATPGDLRGKRFAVPRRHNDSIDWWQATVLTGYRIALQAAGIAEDEVTFVNVDIAREFVADATPGDQAGKSLWGAQSQFGVQREEVAALYRGEVDVLYSDAALSALMRAFTGVRPVIDLSAPEDRPLPGQGFPTILTVSGGLLEQRPDLVERWLVRLLDAQVWGEAHEGDAKRIFGQDTGLPEDFVDAGYSPRVHRQLDVSLAPNRIAALVAKYDHLAATGFIDQPIDFDEFIDHRPLRAATEQHRARNKETLVA